MTTRATEGRLPPGTSSADFGESHEAAGYALVSYLSAPLHTRSKNDYVVMRLRDDVGTPSIDEYRWSVANGSLVDQFTSPMGCVQVIPVNQGQLTVVVELFVGGAVVGTLALRQAVDGGFPRLRAHLKNVHAITREYWVATMIAEARSDMGEPVTTRELLEDFRDYVIRGAALTGNDGVPAKMVGAIAYNEMLHRPKEADLGRWWWSVPGIAATSIIEMGSVGLLTTRSSRPAVNELIRERELAVAADSLNRAAADSLNRVTGSTSLGVCQMQSQTAAMALGLTGWRQRNDRESGGKVNADRAAAYDALLIGDKIDIFNHLRFPKANIALCARLLARIKNRANRWINVPRSVFENDAAAIQIVMHEFNIGPTDSAQADAVAGLQDPEKYEYPEDYGPRVYRRVFNHELMQEYFDNVVGPDFTLGAPVGQGGTNAPADVFVLKQRLASLGFDWLTLDQSMDAATVDVIRLFQAIVRSRDAVGGDGVDGLIDVPGFTYDWLKAVNAPRWVTMPVEIPEVGFWNHELTEGTGGYYGTDWLADAIVGAATSYELDYRAARPEAARMELNDVSTSRGGVFEGHSGHQTGLVCDIRLPRIDGTSGGVTVFDSTFDRGAARALMLAMRTQALTTTILCNDGPLIAEGLCTPDAPGNHVHSNHIHWAIRAPDRFVEV